MISKLKKTIYLLLLSPTIYISCVSKARPDKNNPNDTPVLIKKNAQLLLGSKSDLIMYSDSLRRFDFEIGKFAKEYDSASQLFKEYSQRCSNWTLDTNQIKRIFHEMSSIDGAEWHDFYTYAPCEYDGFVTLKNKNFKYIIGAGSVIHIICSDTTLTFGFRKTNKKLFVNPPAYDEME